MSDAPQAPRTETVTFNTLDHPAIASMSTTETGEWAWHFRIDPSLVANKEHVRLLFLSLIQAAGTWYQDEYGEQLRGG